MSVPAIRSSSVKKLEQHLAWERKKVEAVANKLIYTKATELVETLISIAIDERNPQAINSLLDRAFGKARQNIGLDGGADDKPIVFMPAALMEKFAIKQAEYTELEQNTDSPEYKENGPAGMLITPIPDPTPEQTQ